MFHFFSSSHAQYRSRDHAWNALFILIVIFIFFPGTFIANARESAYSPVLEQILQRAEQSMNAIQSNSVCQDSKKEAYKEQAMLLISRTLDRSMLYNAWHFSYATQTACMRFDLRLLENALQDTATKIIEAANRCDDNAFAVLSSLQDFLFSTYISVLTAGHQPSFSLPTLNKQYIFDTPDNNSSQTTDTAPLCPFTSDYLPSSFAKTTQGALVHIGCTLEVLRELPGDETAFSTAKDIEESSIMLLKQAREGTRLLADIGQIAKTIALLGVEDPKEYEEILENFPSATLLVPRPEEVPHETITGCLTIPSESEAYNREELLLASYTLGRIPDTKVQNSLFPGMFLTNSKTPFSLFLSPALSLLAAINHSHANTPISDISVDNRNFIDVTNEFAQANTTHTNLSQSTLQSAILHARFSASKHMLTSAIQPLLTAASSLTKATSETLPNYIIDLSLFLLQSCIDTYCKESLKTVLRRITNPACFPYASGTVSEKTDDWCFCKDPEMPRFKELCEGVKEEQ